MLRRVSEGGRGIRRHCRRCRRLTAALPLPTADEVDADTYVRDLATLDMQLRGIGNWTNAV